MARIAIAGYMVRHPVAGNMLAYFHYILGMHLLGHEVTYLEESGWPSSSYNPLTLEHGDDPSVGIRIASALFRRYRVPPKILFIHRDGRRWSNVDRTSVRAVLKKTDLLINLGGVNWLPEFVEARRLAYVDMDPVFTQVGGFGLGAIDQHDVHFTYGRNIETGRSSVPDDGIHWIGTNPPVVVDIWRSRMHPRTSDYTTVANWSAYGGVKLDGRHLGQKNVEFMRLQDLPRLAGQRLEIAVGGADDEVVAKLRGVGWRVRDASELSDLRRYVPYIRSSRGEFSVAKEAYVATRCGWFSDRSVCYLAAGLPVVLQDTGFTEWLETDEGIVPFTGKDSALDALIDVDERYASHRRAARRLADTVFAHDRVLKRLIDMAEAG